MSLPSDPTPDDANERYFDAILRHQIGLRRYTAQEVSKILMLLEKSDRDLAALLRKRLAKLAGKPLDLRSERYKALLQEIKAARDAVMGEIRTVTRDDLKALAKAEVEAEQRIMSKTLAIEIAFAAVPTETLYAAVTTMPFSGGPASARTLQQWFDSLRKADQAKLVEALQLGLSEGQTVDDMVRRIVGTRSKKYTDGVLAITRRNAEAVVRTGINHVSNAAREEFWESNADIIYALRWTATLDGRTSAVCRARDGALAPMGNNTLPSGTKRLDPPGARPPAHPNCRSVMVAVFDEEGIANVIGERPYVIDTRTGDRRQKDFRQDAKDAVGADKWKAMTVAQRNDVIKQIRQKWTANHVGRVPADVTYDAWLRRQPAAFQDDVLGALRGKLFRTGKMSMDQFVDRKGKQYTLDQLRATRPEVFKAAGVKDAQ